MGLKSMTTNVRTFVYIRNIHEMYNIIFRPSMLGNTIEVFKNEERIMVIGNATVKQFNYMIESMRIKKQDVIL